MKTYRCSCECGCDLFSKVQRVDLLIAGNFWTKVCEFFGKKGKYDVSLHTKNTSLKCGECGKIFQYISELKIDEKES